MHTVWVRLNAVVFFGLTVIVSLAVVTWLSTFGHVGFPTIDVLKVANVKSLRSHVGCCPHCAAAKRRAHDKVWYLS